MDEKDKKEYEIAVLVKSEDDLAPIAAFVKQHNAEPTGEPRAKKLAFAYEIKKQKEGVFAYWNFKALPEDAKTLEHDLNTNAAVLRSLLIASPAPAMVMNQEGMPMDRRDRRPRPSRPMTFGTGSGSGAGSSETHPSAPKPLSNEALEKKIEEILK